MIKIKLLFLLSIFFLSSCGMGVKPWQREILAREDMNIGGDSITSSLDNHIYFSKEATSGGNGFSAGGCGCN